MSTNPEKKTKPAVNLERDGLHQSIPGQDIIQVAR